MRRLVYCIAAALVAVAPAAEAGSVDGRWDATVEINGSVIPFRIDFSGRGGSFQGALFDGDLKVTSTSARDDDGSIVVAFEHYLTKIEASLKDGELVGKLEGRFERDKYISDYPFHARRHAPAPEASGEVPSIAGLWEIPYASAKGEKSWRFIVRQEGPEVKAAILRVDGDTGTLSGTYKDGKWVVSHFSGSRPLVLEIRPKDDGTLAIAPSGAYVSKEPLTAYRPADARKKGLPEPTDADKHTTVKDPDEPFKFRFPDVNGKVVSDADPRFKGKVVVAVVTGTWCPNCHDEAQFLVQLHKKYRDRGLEVIALDFEEPEQQDDYARVHAFIKKYGVEYPYLIAGAPAEMWVKVPQAVNLNSWPTTFFVGRDGKVKAIHAGFASPASGELHGKLKADFEAKVERLLAEDAHASR